MAFAVFQNGRQFVDDIVRDHFLPNIVGVYTAYVISLIVVSRPIAPAAGMGNLVASDSNQIAMCRDHRRANLASELSRTQ